MDRSWLPEIEKNASFEFQNQYNNLIQGYMIFGSVAQEMIFFVRPLVQVCLELSVFIFLAFAALSELSAQCADFIGQMEPKIIRLVVICM